MIDWRNTYNIGYCLGTILMRASSNGYYPESIEKLLNRSRLFLVAVGDEEDEEPFWMKGRELMTLYSYSKGYRQVFMSELDKKIMQVIEESQFNELYDHYSSHYEEAGYRDLSENYHGDRQDLFQFIRDPKVSIIYSSFQEMADSIKSIDRNITVYKIHTEKHPYYLEEVWNYGKIKENT